MKDRGSGSTPGILAIRGCSWWSWALVAALGATHLRAGTPDPGMGGWSADCQIDERRMRLDFVPATAPEPSDPSKAAEMRATMVLPNGRGLPLQLARSAVRARAVVATPASACSGLGAFLIQDQVYLAAPPVLLLWLSVADRPGWDQLSLVLIDLDKGTVLDQSEFVAPIKDPEGKRGLHIKPATDHARVRLQRRWLYHTGTDSPENSIEAWYRVEVRAGQIRGLGSGVARLSAWLLGNGRSSPNGTGRCGHRQSCAPAGRPPPCFAHGISGTAAGAGSADRDPRGAHGRQGFAMSFRRKVLSSPPGRTTPSATP